MLKIKSMRKFSADKKDDAKARRRAENERALTIVMMFYISKSVAFLFYVQLVRVSNQLVDCFLFLS